MKTYILFILLILNGINAAGQNLIGSNVVEIKKYMKENRREMNNEKVTNSTFRYLKYSDSNDSQTILFFLNQDSVCRSERIICDQRAKIEKIKEFDSVYKKKDGKSWIDTKNGKNYLVAIKDEEWSCIITIEPEK
jgi:hypothetical protein